MIVLLEDEKLRYASLTMYHQCHDGYVKFIVEHDKYVQFVANYLDTNSKFRIVNGTQLVDIRPYNFVKVGNQFFVYVQSITIREFVKCTSHLNIE